MCARVFPLTREVAAVCLVPVPSSTATPLSGHSGRGPDTLGTLDPRWCLTRWTEPAGTLGAVDALPRESFAVCVPLPLAVTAQRPTPSALTLLKEKLRPDTTSHPYSLPPTEAHVCMCTHTHTQRDSRLQTLVLPRAAARLGRLQVLTPLGQEGSANLDSHPEKNLLSKPSPGLKQVRRVSLLLHLQRSACAWPTNPGSPASSRGPRGDCPGRRAWCRHQDFLPACERCSFFLLEL